MAGKSGETLSFHVDLEIHEAAHLITEKLGAELAARTTAHGLVEYDGLDASGARLWLLDRPEPSVLWVSGTVLGDETRAVLSACPFRLGSAGPGPTQVSTASRVEWERLIGELQAERWQLETGPDGGGLVQATGRLPTGQEFYLNFKYDTCYLEVGSTPEDWSAHELPYPHAGYLAPVEAVRMLRQLHTAWLNGTPSNPG